jgi:predicted nuclease of predicted toxin-antitoxin system
VRLKLDENLGRRCLDLFAAAGHDAATVAGQRMTSAADDDLIAACHAEGRALVTLDSDFSNPLVFRPSLYSGIAVLRLPRRPAPADLEAAARTLIEALRREPIDGKLWSVERGRVRVYQEPE